MLSQGQELSRNAKGLHIVPGQRGGVEVFTFEAPELGIYTVHAADSLDAMSRANHFFRALPVEGAWLEKDGQPSTFVWIATQVALSEASR